MIALRLRQQVGEVHVYNLLYFGLKSYRNEGNKEVGMHYAQSLFNRLHKKSWWKSVGTLKEALKQPNEEVLKRLRAQHPRPMKGGQQVPKGGGKGKKGDKTGKNDWGSRGRSDDWSPLKPAGQRRDPSDRSRSRERRDQYERDGPGGKNRDKDGGPRGGPPGKGPLGPRVQRCFTLCKDKKR